MAIDVTSPCPRLPWLARFAARLMQVHPRVDATMAGMYAQCAYAVADRALPETVAESFIGRAEAPLDRPPIV